MGFLSRTDSTSQDAGDDHAGRAAAHEARQERLRQLEARRARALERIWRRISETESSGRQHPMGTTRSTRHLRPDDAGTAIRSLVQEMQKDPELADALREDLVASLHRAARDRMERTLSDRGLVDAQHQLFGTDQYDKTSQVSHALWLQQALASLQSGHSDLVSMLLEVQDLLHTLQLSQLKAAVVLSVTSLDGPAGSSAIVRNSVDVADSLEKFREVTSELAKSAEIFQEATRELTGRVEAARELSRSTSKLREATRELSRSTERLRIEVQHMVDDRLAGDRNKLNSGFLFHLGEMFDLRPRLQHPAFDPGLENAFRSVGDLLTCSLLSAWQENEARHTVSRSDQSR